MSQYTDLQKKHLELQDKYIKLQDKYIKLQDVYQSSLDTTLIYAKQLNDIHKIVLKN